MTADSFGRKEEAYLANDYSSQPKPIKPNLGQIDDKVLLESVKSTTPAKIRSSHQYARKSCTLESDSLNQPW